MEDDKSTSSRSRVSSGSHMDVTLVGDKKDVNRTFCMKQNTGIDARFWPKGKVLYMHTLTIPITQPCICYNMNSRDFAIGLSDCRMAWRGTMGFSKQ